METKPRIEKSEQGKTPLWHIHVSVGDSAYHKRYRRHYHFWGEDENAALKEARDRFQGIRLPK